MSAISKKWCKENLEKGVNMCSKITIKTPGRRRRRTGVFIVNFGLFSHHCFYC